MLLEISVEISFTIFVRSSPGRDTFMEFSGEPVSSVVEASVTYSEISSPANAAGMMISVQAGSTRRPICQTGQQVRLILFFWCP